MKQPIIKLGIGLVVLIFAWQWWVGSGPQVTVTGDATVSAAPDEYIFSPQYQATGSDETTIRDEVTERGNGVVAGLKELGVEDKQLSSSVTVYDDYRFAIPEIDTVDEKVATFALTVTLNDYDKAQEVQDYLAGTPLVGALTPVSTFADDTRKELERQARKQALEDAQLQANDTAQALGIGIIKVESIGKPAWGGPIPFEVSRDTAEIAASSSEEIATTELLVGEQDISYSIQVTYRVR